MIPLYFLLSLACFPSVSATPSGSEYQMNKPWADSANTYARLVDERYVPWREPVKADLGLPHDNVGDY